MEFALAAGDLFDLSVKSEYVETIVCMSTIIFQTNKSYYKDEYKSNLLCEFSKMY